MTVKEIKLSPNISAHDMEYRVKNAIKYLEKGFKVKCTLQFRGREIVHRSIGEETLKKFVAECSQHGEMENSPRSEGKRIFVFIRKRSENGKRRLL